MTREIIFDRTHAEAVVDACENDGHWAALEMAGWLRSAFGMPPRTSSNQT